MTRKKLQEILSGEEQGLYQVWGWYQFQRALIGEEKSRVLNAVAARKNLSASRYVGVRHEELDRQFAYQVFELNQVPMLGMLSCTEAALRINFIERVSEKKKDAVSKTFWNCFRKLGSTKSVWKKIFWIHGARNLWTRRFDETF